MHRNLLSFFDDPTSPQTLPTLGRGNECVDESLAADLRLLTVSRFAGRATKNPRLRGFLRHVRSPKFVLSSFARAFPPRLRSAPLPHRNRAGEGLEEMEGGSPPKPSTSDIPNVGPGLAPAKADPSVGPATSRFKVHQCLSRSRARSSRPSPSRIAGRPPDLASSELAGYRDALG